MQEFLVGVVSIEVDTFRVMKQNKCGHPTGVTPCRPVDVYQFFCSEEVGSILLRNVGEHLPDQRAPHTGI
jgi:hypothetical protein